jgi:hypothetical protein
MVHQSFSPLIVLANSPTKEHLEGLGAEVIACLQRDVISGTQYFMLSYLQDIGIIFNEYLYCSFFIFMDNKDIRRAKKFIETTELSSWLLTSSMYRAFDSQDYGLIKAMVGKLALNLVIHSQWVGISSVLDTVTFREKLGSGFFSVEECAKLFCILFRDYGEANSVPLLNSLIPYVYTKDYAGVVSFLMMQSPEMRYLGLYEKLLETSLHRGLLVGNEAVFTLKKMAAFVVNARRPDITKSDAVNAAKILRHISELEQRGLVKFLVEIHEADHANYIEHCLMSRVVRSLLANRRRLFRLLPRA